MCVDAVNMIYVVAPCHVLMMQEPKDRLRKARTAAGYPSARAAALKFGWGESSYAAHENGQNGIRPTAAAKYAKAFRTSAAYILTGESPPAAPRKTVNLVGYVAAGAQAHFGHGQGPFDEIDAPEDATEHTVAVEIRGESLGALFDTWIVFYDDVHEPPRGELLGKLCVCGLTDGRVLIKKLTKGQLPNAFTLLSNVEPPIYDVFLDWAARVKLMRPR